MSNITILKEELPIPYVCYDYCGYIPLFSYDDTFKEFYICECFKPTFYAIFEMGLIKELPDLLKEFFIKHHVNSYEDAINKLPFKPHICHECNKKTPKKVWSSVYFPRFDYNKEYRDLYSNIKKQVWPYYQKKFVAYGKPPLFLKKHDTLCPSKLWNIFVRECGIPTYDLFDIESNENIKELRKTSLSFVKKYPADDMMKIVNEYIGKEVIYSFGNTISKYKGETQLGFILREIFPEKTIITHYTPTFLDGLELDFFIPDLNLAFEYQGQQHYKPIGHWGGGNKLLIQQEHDERKKKLAKRKNINIIEISYDDHLTKEFIFKKIKNIINLDNKDICHYNISNKNVISKTKSSFTKQEKIDFPQLSHKDKELAKIYTNFDFDKAIELIENGANPNTLFFSEEQILPKDINAFYGANLFLLSCAYIRDWEKWKKFTFVFKKANGNIFKKDISNHNAIHYALKNEKISHKILEYLLDNHMYPDLSLWGCVWYNESEVREVLANYLIKNINSLSSLDIYLIIRHFINDYELFASVCKSVTDFEIRKNLLKSLMSLGSIDSIKKNKEYIMKNKELITKEIYMSISRGDNELENKIIFLNSIAPLKQEETGEVFLYFIRCGDIDEDTLKFMLSLNWNFSAIDKEGKNALIHIYEHPGYRAKTLAQILIEKYKLNVNLQDNDGKTAAMYAAKRGCLHHIIKYVDLNIKDNKGRTLQDYCTPKTLLQLNEYIKSKHDKLK